MRILITGAGGNLGRVLAPALAEAGHQPLLLDNRPVNTEYEFVEGDVCDRQQLEQAMQGVEAVVHGAALHGIHLGKYQPGEFWRINVTGTFNVYEAAREVGVKKVLLASTMGVYGASVASLQATDGVPVVHEGLPLLPSDVYGLSKKLCEELAEFHARAHGIATVAYRLGMFVPEDFVRYGFRLLKGGVDDRDVAQAFLLGLEHAGPGFEAFNIFAAAEFAPAEMTKLKESPQLLEERYPGISELLESRGERPGELLEMWGFTYWSIDRARQRLAYRPKHNFAEFVEALRRGDEEYYPFANLPWWGV